MTYTEESGSVFDIDIDKYYLAHCVSKDFALGKGIAVEFERRFRLRHILIRSNGQIGDAVLVGRVFNLITKPIKCSKPTYYTLESTLIKMRELCNLYNIEYLAMPRIACGLDRLTWSKVRAMIKDIFSSSSINILVRTG
jgi:hypothetical protein